MKRLMNNFAELFDLDRKVRDVRLGELIQRAIDDLEEHPLPDWGSPGPVDRFACQSGRPFDFYYAPHLFPGMDLSLRLGHKLQFYMLPRSVPAAAPLTLAAVLESYCHLSGDLFGWEMLEDGKFLIWIVDISGHGVRAGLASAVLKVLIENLRHRSRIAALVNELNDTFVDCLREDRGDLFATGVFMAISADGTVCYTSAGHPPIMVRKTDGRLVEFSSNGMPVGMFRDRGYQAVQTRIEPGDTLMLYTDGVVESTNADDEEFSLDRLRSILMSSGVDSPASLSKALFKAISDHQDMARLDDDVTFVTARMKPLARD